MFPRKTPLKDLTTVNHLQAGQTKYNYYADYSDLINQFRQILLLCGLRLERIHRLQLNRMFSAYLLDDIAVDLLRKSNSG